MSVSRNLLCAALLAALPVAALHAAEVKPSRGEAPLQAVLEKSGTHLMLAVPDVAKLRAEDEHTDAKPGTPLRYGVVQQARLDLAAKAGVGQWQVLKDGRLHWRLDVSAQGASSLEFGFSRFRLPHGAELLIRSADGREALAPLTDADNPLPGKPLHTPLLQADAAVLELFLPADKRDVLQLELANASYGYRDPFSTMRAKSGSCNIDTACPEGDAWREQIASAAGYTFETNASRLYCSGTLMNTGNNAQDNAHPRFSTAFHCLSTQSVADTMVLYWGYESPTCRALNSTENGTQLPVASNTRAVQTGGATLLAANRATDFVALQLNTPVPDDARVYFSGWDRSGTAPQGAVGIHHPSGHEKRISFNTDPLSTMENCIIASTDTSTHWRVNDWEQGTTERGSSGSGLWDSGSGLFVGVLSGGTASCSLPSGYDCYGRLSSAWEADSTTGDTVRAAFDRSGTNPQTMPGRASCDAPVVTLSASAFSNAPRAGSNFQIRASASGGAGRYTYLWDVDGDGIIEREGSTRNITVSFPNQHSGNVRVLVRDAAGCIGSATHALDVLAPQVEVVSVGTPQQVCGNDDDTLDPGERYRVPITLRNTGNAPLAARARALFAPGSTLIGNGQQNAYGYEGASQCDYQFIDIAQGSHAVAALQTYVANGNTYGPNDDARSTEIALGGNGFPLYGTTYTRAVMSTNGYVSFDPEESGGNWRVSCDGTLENGAKGPQLRPHHDDMKVREDAGAGLRYRWFASCPRVAASGLPQGCHVFQWTGMSYYISSTESQGNFEFQAVAYAQTGEVAYQYRTAAPDHGNGAAIGLIGVGGADHLNLACKSNNGPAQAQSALCIHSPEAVAAAPVPLRVESPTLSLPALAAGASTTVNLPVRLNNDISCGTPLQIEYLATAASANHSTRASSHSIGNVGTTCQAVSNCRARVSNIDLRDGNYYNPQRSGNGINLYPQGGTWYTADTDHTPMWYQAVGNFVDNLLQTNLRKYRSEAGPRLAVQGESVGRMHIARISANNAMLAWRFNDGRAGAELVQYTAGSLARPTPNYTQHWYSPGESGWGLDVESLLLGEGRIDPMLMYLYDAQGAPRWLLGDADGTAPEYRMLLHRPHCPGCLHYKDWNGRASLAGSGVLRWNSDASATMSTSIDLPAPLQGQWLRQDVDLIRIGEIRP